MAKRDDKQSDAEDYLEQLEWQGRHPPRRGSSTIKEPNWKYKIVYPKRPPMHPAMRGLVIIGIPALILYWLYKIFVVDSGLAIYLGVIALFTGVIIFLAARDATKPTKNDED